MIITFVVMDVLYFAVWCRPFHEYWAVPTNSRQCDAATNHLITNAVFNLTSDVAMLLIVLPIFLRLKMTWRKKVPVILLFSLGIFTILAAILNKVYSFSQPFGAQWTYWYTRESSTALLVANLPFVWTLWRKMPGVKRIFGTYNSQAPKGDTANSPRNDSKADANPPTNLSALEMLEGVPADSSGRERRMTFAEMLGEPNPASVGEKEPTPITHPQLFYARKPSSQPAIPMEEAVLVDTPEQETVRRDSNPEKRSAEPVDTSAYPSITSKKSTGSFV